MARKKNWILTFVPLIIFCVLYISPAYSQPIPFNKKYADSILHLLPAMAADSTKVKHLVELTRMYFNVNGDKAIAFAKEGETIARKIRYQNGIVNSLKQEAFFYGVTGDWPKASNAINLIEKMDSAQAIFVSNMRWLVSVSKNDTLDALKWALKSIHHPKFKKLDEIDTWPSYMQVTRCYTTIGQLDSAEYFAGFLKKFIPKYGDIIPDLKLMSIQTLGEIAIKRKDYPTAIAHFREARGSYGLAKTFHEMKESDSAIYYALQTVNITSNFMSPGFVIDAANILVEEYRSKDPATALKYQQLLLDTQDKLYNAQKVRQMEAVNLEHQQAEFDLLAKAEADRNRFLRAVFLGALFFLSLFIFALWRNNNAKRITNGKLEQSFKDLEAAQSQLIQAEKMASLGELTAGIAHEIQNPLNFVNNFSDVNTELIDEVTLAINSGNSEEAKELLSSLRANEEKIKHHGQRADAIVKSMLQHSRTSTGIKEPTDINVLADEYLRLAYHGLRAKDKTFNATLQTDYDQKIEKVDVISQEIGRVLLNLFTNAFYVVAEKKKNSGVDYVPTVSVSTKQIGNKIEILIKDNGSGIPQKFIDKIFQPFFTTKPTGQGTGLGLSLSYDIIKAHGGELKVESKECEYAEFVILLPMLKN